MVLIFFKLRSYAVEREKPETMGVGRAYIRPTPGFSVVPYIHLAGTLNRNPRASGNLRWNKQRFARIERDGQAEPTLA
jgi:hypothetical protein